MKATTITKGTKALLGFVVVVVFYNVA